MASMGLNMDEQKAVERFRKQVVEPSQGKLVILDFWAEWCGPCKALTPVLEKVAGEYADKGVILAKVNVDEEKFIASQFQVQSIPTVYAMFQGQPVADLTPMRSESQLKAALDQLLEQLPVQAGAGGDEAGGQPDMAQLVAMGEQVLADGDGERAAGIFMQIVQMAPDRADAQAGLLRALLAAGQADAASQHYDGLPDDLKQDQALAQVKTAIDLSGNQVDSGELATLRAAAAERPADSAAQIAFAEAAFAAGERDEAADTLLRSIEGSAGTEEEGAASEAKTSLLKMFEAVGLEHPWVAAQRRRLSLILFG